MNFVANAHKVLNNYDYKKFHDNLEKEIARRGLKKKAFCEQIKKPSNWITRRLKYKPEFPDLITMQELGYDILKLAGIESKNNAFRIPYERDKDKEIRIQGVRVKLDIFYNKVRVLLSYPEEHKILVGVVDSLYTTLQDKMENATSSLKEKNTI